MDFGCNNILFYYNKNQYIMNNIIQVLLVNGFLSNLQCTPLVSSIALLYGHIIK